jgi:hypothetical protein
MYRTAMERLMARMARMDEMNGRRDIRPETPAVASDTPMPTLSEMREVARRAKQTQEEWAQINAALGLLSKGFGRFSVRFSLAYDGHARDVAGAELYVTLEEHREGDDPGSAADEDDDDPFCSGGRFGLPLATLLSMVPYLSEVQLQLEQADGRSRPADRTPKEDA